MNHYFEEEIQQFQVAAREFSKTNPDKAHLFDFSNPRNRDPYVERLFSGIALLNSKLRKDLHQNLESISEAVLEQHWPRVLLECPAMMMVEVDTIGLDESIFLEKHRSLFNTPALGPEKTLCQFSTVADETIVPLFLKDVQYFNEGPLGILHINLALSNSVDVNKIKSGNIKLHLCGEESTAFILYQALTQTVSEVYVITQSNDTVEANQVKKRLGSQTILKSANLDWHLLDAMEIDSIFPTAGLMLDFGNYLEKFLFVEMSDLLENLKNSINFQNARCFSIEIVFKKVLFNRNLDLTDNIKLNSFPVINLFLKEAEPFQASLNRLSYPIVLDVGRPDSMFPLKVEDMTGLLTRHVYQNKNLDFKDSKNSEDSTVVFYPMQTCILSQEGAAPNTNNYYTVSYRRVTSRPATLSVTLSWGYAVDSFPISYRVWAHNGDYPFYYMHSGMQFYAKTGRHTLVLNSLSKPTRGAYPFESTTSSWRWIEQLSLSLSDLSDLVCLKKLLIICLRQKKYVDSIIESEVEVRDFLQAGIMKSQALYTILVDERKFINSGELYLFGIVLYEFLKAFSPINYSLKLSIKELFSGKEGYFPLD